MVGDAMGDLEAAKANGVLYYPINPGAEDASWLASIMKLLTNSSMARSPALSGCPDRGIQDLPAGYASVGQIKNCPPNAFATQG
jgi:hypothetical protein